jgi:hypothetical protein
MTDHLRFSRWRRLTGAHRILEKRLPTHRAEPQRLTLYLPGALLDDVEALALRAGRADVQAYCEALLARAIVAEAERVRDESRSAAVHALTSIEQMARDEAAMEEWSAASTIVVEPRGDDGSPGGAAPERSP